MTLIYAESSAVLRWLLGAPDAPTIRKILVGASTVLTSALTVAEVGRTLHRLVSTGSIDVDGRDRARAVFRGALAHWSLIEVSEAILSRAAESFPVEPLRTLDAVHLASALWCSHEIGSPVVLSTDARIRENAEELGLKLSP